VVRIVALIGVWNRSLIFSAIHIGKTPVKGISEQGSDGLDPLNVDDQREPGEECDPQISAESGCSKSARRASRSRAGQAMCKRGAIQIVQRAEESLADDVYRSTGLTIKQP